MIQASLPSASSSEGFFLRHMQRPMFDIMTSLDRCNVFASPGTGKTSGTLAAIDCLSLVETDVFPILVVAPKRVANSVWSGETDRFFKGMRVSRVLGTPAEREAALKARADIYTINPANLTWLHETLPRWPFKTVICDESTLMKSHRCRFQKSSLGKTFLVKGGAKHASNLMQHAPRTKRWINLTGTPTPNGVKDLWGQQWPIDFGKALGSSYSAFSQRWFRQAYGSTPEQQRFEPLPGAEDEIVNAIAPVSALVDAYDYLDIERPVELDIMIDLPPKVRKQYNAIHKESVLELKGKTITAVNAGSVTMKCIGRGTPTLTDSGWKPIEEVGLRDRVWDGERFVKHDGVVSKGERAVVKCWGVEMTPDHKVMTKKGWKEAQEINANAEDRHNRPHIRTPDCCGESTQPELRDSVEVSVCVRNRSNKADFRFEEGEGLSLRMQTQRNTEEETGVSRNDRPSDVGSLAIHGESLHSDNTRILGQIWRERDNRLREVDGVQRVQRGHGEHLGKRTHARESGQRQRILQGELPMGDLGATSEQHLPVAFRGDVARENDNNSSWKSCRSVSHHDKTKEGERLADRKDAATQSTETFDIVNAGPKFRFTVKGENGEVILVHNCRSIASGFIRDEDRIDHTLHGEKLDALADLRDSLNGAPLLVAYWFKHDLKAIQGKFKDAVLFPKGGQAQIDVERAWNEGKIPMLLISPASTAHGISLQHGGNHLCIYTVDWNAEYYEQVIERIGPARQAGSGYKRLTYVHRLIAANTWEQTVADRLREKFDVSEAVKRGIDMARMLA